MEDQTTFTYITYGKETNYIFVPLASKKKKFPPSWLFLLTAKSETIFFFKVWQEKKKNSLPHDFFSCCENRNKDIFKAGLTAPTRWQNYCPFNFNAPVWAIRHVRQNNQWSRSIYVHLFYIVQELKKKSSAIASVNYGNGLAIWHSLPGIRHIKVNNFQGTSLPETNISFL